MELTTWLKDEMSTRGIPGGAAATVRASGAIQFATAGVASRETGCPIRVDTLFRVGSVTKAYTALLMLLLVEDGLCDLFAPVQDYVDGLDPAIGRTNLHQLMTHTAGLAKRIDRDGPLHDGALGDAVRGLSADAVFAPPGRTYSYSDEGFAIAGLVATEVTHQSWADLMDRRVLGPLGLATSTFRIKEAITRPIALGHMRAKEGPPQVVRPMPEHAALAPAGGLYSNLTDLARFASILAHRGELEGRQYIPSRIVDEMITPHASVPGSTTCAYGYGLWVRDLPAGRVGEHLGGYPGYAALLRVAPRLGRGYVLLSNLEQEDFFQTQAKIGTALALELPSPRRFAFIPHLTKRDPTDDTATGIRES
jgi:D-alanyl-D-alanine carboxypeptidase